MERTAAELHIFGAERVPEEPSGDSELRPGGFLSAE